MPKRFKTADMPRMTPCEAMRVLAVSRKTLIRMAERGEIHAYVLPSGHRRYNRAEIEALAEREAVAS